MDTIKSSKLTTNKIKGEDGIESTTIGKNW